jgi:hypothetical protein
MTAKQSERARHTHRLGSADGETSQKSETKRASEGCSRPGEHGGETSQDSKTKRACGTPTSWRARKEEQVRIVEQSEQVRHTHCLEYTREGQVRRRGKSKRRALTIFRAERETIEDSDTSE